LENLQDIEQDPRYEFVRGDIADGTLVDELLASGVDAIVNVAAESHVDRGILDPAPFVKSNVEGVQVLLEGARRREVSLFLQVSTDEVYGSADDGAVFTESSPLQPNSPYSASKAAAECFCRAYWVTYGVPVVITRSSNNYGRRQYPEKLIPLVITNALEDRPIPVYGDGSNVRDWLHVEDHCRGLAAAIESGRPGEAYNFAGGTERSNIDIVRLILDELSKPHSLIEFVADRLGHDFRYALDSEKARTELGWAPEVPFAEGIRDTIEWLKREESWWKRVKSGDYWGYYDRVYANR
ncbi:MAG: dTDP-glucose 4,6-dehydratase, partial [Chloroflexota bacterium]